MDRGGKELEFQVLDLLADGPSSFAAIYSGINRLYPRGSERLGVDVLWGTICAARESGLLRLLSAAESGQLTPTSDLALAQARIAYERWLPDAAYDEMCVDEVGLWLELLPEGRYRWEAWSEPEAVPKWTVDQDPQTLIITVHAVDVAEAERALETWAQLSPGIELLPGTREIRSVSGFRLRDGSTVGGGVRLRTCYRERQAPPQT